MTPNQVTFSVTERRNVHAPKGKEWALFAQFGAGARWCLHTWNKSPKQKDVDGAVALAMRCFEVYHASMTHPPFNLKAAIEPINAE
jgi:hypothetical protein